MDRDTFAGATSLQELAAQAISFDAARFPDQVWHGAALARTIDSALYAQLAGSATPEPSFEDFTANPDVTVIDAKARVFQLRAAARDRILPQLATNKSALEAVSKPLLARAMESSDPFEKLALLIIASPEVGEDYFDILYRAADSVFDLSGCDALLNILRQRAALLTPKLHEKLVAREQYLSSRLRFLDDFYRTTSYLDRGQFLARFRSFVAPTTLDRLRNTNWLLNIHGKGGTGKTMFLRWVVARHCIPEHSAMRTPVTRLDIDLVYRALLIQEPWLALLSIAAQLSSQLPGPRFSSLEGPNETALRNRLHNRSPLARAEDEQALLQTGAKLKEIVEDKFCSGLGDERAVVIIDTIEELSLHYPAVLGNLLDMLHRVRQRCPNLRVVLSGRYPVFGSKRALLGLPTKLRKQLARERGDLRIGPMSDDESRRYLTEVRRIGAEQPLTEIVRAANGNPFTLALFADLASAKTLTAEDIKTSNIAFIYLIDRIIDRIPDEDERPDDADDERKRKRAQRGMRWLLRYAVVRRRLTQQFAAAVLADFMRDEISGSTSRDDETNLERAGPRYVNVRPWRRFGLPIEFSEVWSALVSYASSSSWVSMHGGELELQSEVVVPMRQLLTQNIEKYPIWLELHRKAAEYFEGLARDGTSVSNHLANALYHRYQAEGQGARQWWCHYLKECRETRGDYVGAVQELAESLFSNDYLDDQRRPLHHFSNTSIVDERTLADAAVEAFLALALREVRAPDKNQPALRARMSERFADLVLYGHDRCDARTRLARLAAHARAIELPPQTEKSGPVLPEELEFPDEQVLADLLLGSAAAPGSHEQKEWYAKALVISEVTTRCAFPPYYLRSLLAQVDAIAGRHVEAFDSLCKSVLAAVYGNAPALQISDLMLRAGDLGFAIGRWEEVEALAAQVVSLPSPAHEEASGWLLRAALDRFDYARAATLVQGLKTEVEPTRHEYAADWAAALFRFSEADREYSEARTGYLALQYTNSAAQVLLKYGRYYLDVVGAPQRAVRLLDPLIGAPVPPEPTIDFELNLLLVRLYARLRDPIRARSRFNLAVALVADHKLPRVHIMIATATLLAEGVGTQEDARALARLFAAATVSTKLAALRPFLTGSGNARMQLDIVLPQADLNMAPQDQLSITAALIFFQRTDQALLFLRSLSNLHVDDSDLLAVLLRLARRISPDALLPPHGWVDTWVQRAEADRSYAGVVLLEEVERLVAAGSVTIALLLLEKTKFFLSDLPPDSRWREILLRLNDLRQESADRTDVNLVRALAVLPPHELVSPTRLLRIEANTDENRLQLDWPQEAPTMRTNYVGVGEQELYSAAIANDLYAPSFASLLKLEGNILYQAFARFWKLVTGRILPLAGVERVRREVEFILKGSSWLRSGPGAMAIDAQMPALAAVPWELASNSSDRFYRTQGGSSNPDTIRYLRRAIEHIGLAQVIEGASAWLAWSQFVSALGGPERFRKMVLLRVPPPDRRCAVVLQPEGHWERRGRQGYGAFGLRLSEFYRRKGLEVIALSMSLQALESALRMSNPPSLIHIATSIGETRTPREAFVRGDSGEPIRAEDLTRALLRPRISDSLRPFVILDIADDPFDRGRTLLLRNVFASRLFAEATRGVLAMGPYPADQLNTVVGSLVDLLTTERLAIADLHTNFWKTAQHLHAPALFTLDPDLPVWE